MTNPSQSPRLAAEGGERTSGDASAAAPVVPFGSTPLGRDFARLSWDLAELLCLESRPARRRKAA